MRITLHLDGQTPDVPCPYAVIWLDACTRTWQREGYVGIDLHWQFGNRWRPDFRVRIE